MKRWGFLAAVAIWVFSPFATGRRIGTGDALWYANMLADFVLQLRAGVFPVFVGQTEYAFNGAVYPLRVAPLYQHVGGVLDFLTAHHLSFFGLQHLIVIAVGIGGMISCYACLVAIAPEKRWAAALLTTLYITCPGVLGVIFIQDLYMSWMTLPFLPLVVFGVVRSYSNDDTRTWFALAIGLGGTWLAHAPIALWMTGIAGATQLVRLMSIDRTWESWKRALGGGTCLVALSFYPFVSTYLLQGPGSGSASGGALDHPEKIVAALHAAFPGSLLPLSIGAGELSDLQLGYGLLLALVIGLVAFAAHRQRRLGMVLAVAAGIVLILLPIPYWTEGFWLRWIPEVVRRLTFYWPMHRLYLVLASFTVFIGMLGLESAASSRRKFTQIFMVALLVGCGWSLWESRQFHTASGLRTASAEDTARKERPENRLLMNHAYGLFPKLPPYFSNGVMDPTAEFRLLDPITREPLPNPLASESRPAAEGDFIGSPDANPGIINFSPSVTLSPGKHYDLEFTFLPLNYTGILQLVGASFFREYALPSTGEIRAFGTRLPNSPLLPLWTTQTEPETVALRFIPTGEDAAARDYSQFAHFRLLERVEETQRVQVKGWIPLNVTVSTPSPALLETPRMATPGYEATSNGEIILPLATSAGLVALPVAPGSSTMELRFRGPLLLRVAYWGELLVWAAVGAWIISHPFINRREKMPTKP